MLGRWLGGGFSVALCSALLWTGCSGESSSGPIDSPSDAGGHADAGGDQDDAATDGGAPDSGKLDPDAPIDAPEVSLTYGSCPAKTPCGGDPKGTWKYAAGGCIDEVDFSSFCEAAVIKETNLKARGIIAIGATDFERAIEGTMSVKFEVPRSCLLDAECAVIGSLLKTPPPNGPGLSAGTCKPAAAAGVCECEGTKKISDKRATTYTIDGNTLNTADGEIYDYCVEGNQMTYRQSFEGLVEGNVVMTK